MTRMYQLQISLDDRLLAAIRFSAMRDGLAPSQKARQILTQGLQRTMDSPAFQEHYDMCGATQEPLEERDNGR